MRQPTSAISSRLPRALPVVAALLLALAALPVAAQTSGSSQRPTSGQDRMFLNFFEEATVVDSQWWEGRLEHADFDFFDATILRGVAAFAVLPDLEVGGTVGFGSSSSDDPLPDGTGATDLDVYGKYYFGTSDGKTEFAAGGVLTIPTGDDTAGLGSDAFALGGFGSLRYRLKRVILGGNIGFRINGDAQRFGLAEVDGKFSASLGFGAIIPFSDRLSFVPEMRFETKRFEGGDAYLSVLAGINWRVTNRGQLRAAIDFGFEDAAPDWRFTVGYAHAF